MCELLGLLIWLDMTPGWNRFRSVAVWLLFSFHGNSMTETKREILIMQESSFQFSTHLLLKLTWHLILIINLLISVSKFLCVFAHHLSCVYVHLIESLCGTVHVYKDGYAFKMFHFSGFSCR